MQRLALLSGIGFVAIVLAIAAIVTRSDLERSKGASATFERRLEPPTPEPTVLERDAVSELRSDELVADSHPIIDEARRSAVESSAIKTPANPGRLVLQVVDPSLLGPLRWFNVRLASTTRFADERGDDAHGEFALALTPGSYAAYVSSPGYEAREIASLEIRSGETEHVAPIELEPGSGAIRVRIIGDANSDRTFTAVLTGAGRHPCEHCADREPTKMHDDPQTTIARAWARSSPCAQCGFSSRLSSRWMHRGEAFEFTHLASGEYALRLSDDHGETIGAGRGVTLAPRERATVVFDASSERAVEIELFDVDGTSLSQEWRRRMEGKPDVEIGTAQGEVESWGWRFTISNKNRELMSASIVPPDASGRRRVTPTSFGGRRLGKGVARDHTPGAIVDRARRANDSLRPAIDTPEIVKAEIECALKSDGLVTISRVPSSALRVRVTGAHSYGEAWVPVSSATTHVAVHVQPR
jgi:hypothetical protein